MTTMSGCTGRRFSSRGTARRHAEHAPHARKLAGVGPEEAHARLAALLADQRLREAERRELLADAVGAGEQVRVVDATRLERALDRATCRVLRAELGQKCLGHRSRR